MLLNYCGNLAPKYFLSLLKRDYIYISTYWRSILEIIFLLNLHINLQLKMLMDLVGIDYPSNQNRFQLVYNLLSINYGVRCFIKCQVDEVSSIPSLLFVYPSVSWYERECWDLFGIHFRNNPDLRRILTDYGFSGHPLRKDFPLSGYTEVAFAEKRKNIMHKPISLVQDLRIFATITPWNYYWQFEEPTN